MTVSSPATVTYALNSVHRDPGNQFPLIAVYQRTISTDQNPTLITINLSGADVTAINAVPNDVSKGPLLNFAHAIDTYLVAQGILTGTVS